LLPEGRALLRQAKHLSYPHSSEALENYSFFFQVSPELCSHAVKVLMGGQQGSSGSFHRQSAGWSGQMLCTTPEAAVHLSTVQVALWPVLSFSINCAGSFGWLI